MADKNTGEFILYVSEDGELKIDVRLLNETIWLTQKQMAEMFKKNVSTINEHIKNIFDEAELDQNLTIRNFRIVQQEGDRSIEREVQHYNLDVIISVGYRVKSNRGTQFRIWATKVLREYIVKGFAMDDARLKNGGSNNYFDELLARIRDIRASEKMFYRKVLDIYATSVDYNPKTAESQKFFQTVQNKMHWAAHGHTAAEVIYSRVDGTKPNMGMTSLANNECPKAKNIVIAKNYLDEKEIDLLNRIVTMYLDFAEFQASNGVQMYMKDWLDKLDQFLNFNGRDVLDHYGKISHQQAENKAKSELKIYKQHYVDYQTPVDKHFEEAIKDVKQIAKKQKDNRN
ncbi:MAG: virulence RhuM family protein [Acinetobacter populi]|uniref:virulence RhuM family protein n=1 Tax=Acinetobacter populi TaxID=1582270 RepID=UPI002356121C|nr:virulence RhuM family protein [Acinetobacter populi]MCH4248632.1 virulence RhuM family protein [Acinetobacter populi]